MSDSAVDSLHNVISLSDGLSQVIQRAGVMRRHEHLPDEDHLDLEPRTARSPADAVLRGRIKWFDAREGMGYIAVARGSEVPVHCQDFKVFSRAPKPGEQVEFVIEHGRACDVRLLKPSAET
ncbi:cold shock domain-containing protein [Streptomyces sp. TP-A0356]|uniref:cold shock domain-containing protein n=1 Tax=Streptomyces sp. TP-A0356 TaxID=1359208 RepID=UPI00131D623B|nr:cold shock domain-containing protein [Streptomyces sp. TP-A0356]